MAQADGYDIMITGSGSLAQAVLFALSAADAGRDLRLAISGRNTSRLAWLSLAANGRSVSYRRRNFTTAVALDWSTPESLAATLAETRPRLVVQTASMQSPWTLAPTNAWARMIVAGGYGEVRQIGQSQVEVEQDRLQIFGKLVGRIPLNTGQHIARNLHILFCQPEIALIHEQASP